jgi:3-keto-5-aminohexanoate cleavage enzyme
MPKKIIGKLKSDMPEKKFIMNLAPTGSMTAKAQTPHIPITVREIFDDVRQCVDLGVNIIHLHGRDETGRPSHDRAFFKELIARIRDRYPDLIICASLSARHITSMEQRLEPLLIGEDARPDMGSLTLSSMNFPNSASVNSPSNIRELAGLMLENGIKPELEVFDLGMMNYARYLIDRQILRPPFYFNIILNNIAGAQMNLLHLAAILDGLPDRAYCCIGGIGRAQLEANLMGLLHGDGVRIGLEDNYWYCYKESLATNARLVERIVRLAAELDSAPAGRGEVRSWLKLGE